MIKFYICLVTLFVVNGAMAQWIQQNSGTSNVLNSVYFTDTNTGYVVGDYGTILKTTNGGADWTPLVSGTDDDLFSVYFIDASYGFAVGGGNHEIILKTINGGTTWNATSTGINSQLYSIYFPNDSTGYTVGYDGGKGVMLKTINGGTSWTTLNGGNLNSYVLLSVYFLDANKGYVAGVSPYDDIQTPILKTIDGGTTWQKVSNGPVNLCSIFFPNDNTGYAVGWGEKMYKTTDAGVTWTKLFGGTTPSLVSVHFLDENIGYAASTNGSVIKTTDGGIFLSRMSTGTSSDLHEVYFTDRNTGYVVGDYGKILKTTNGGGEPLILNVSPVNQCVSSSAGTTYFLVNSDTNWTVSSNASWCNVTASGSGNDSILVTYFKNASDSLRIANIQVLLPAQPRTIRNVTVTQSKPTSGVEEFMKNYFQIYPNPAEDKIIIESYILLNNICLSILSVNGQEVFECKITEQKTQIDIHDLPPGVYFVKLQNEKTVEVGKIVIK